MASSRANLRWDVATKVRAAFTRAPLWWCIIVVSFLALWQWLPSIPGISNTIHFLTPFFISSPKQCAIELYRILTGAHHTAMVWGPFARTVLTALIGSSAAIVVGSIGGLLCSNWVLVNRVARPFIVLLNALPKVALIPIVVLLAGPSATSDAVVAFLVVIFVVFFNAYEGGLSVSDEMLNNVKIFGAGWAGQMWKVRWPVVMAWTFAVMPNAIAFGLVGTVTSELFTGSAGLGRTLEVAVDTADANLTFAVVVLLGIAGVVLVLVADHVRQRILHWW